MKSSRWPEKRESEWAWNHKPGFIHIGCFIYMHTDFFVTPDKGKL
jgi:hypothetical protein